MLSLEYAFISLPEEFGAAVRAARKAQGMSQMQLAEACGCSQRFVSQLERGKETAELGKALQAATAVGLRLRLDGSRTPDESRALVERGVDRIAASLHSKKRRPPRLADYLEGAG